MKSTKTCVMSEQRIYIVYQDFDEGKSQHVVAKNRKEAWTKVDFKADKVAWRPWLKLENGRAVDEFGKDHGSVSE